jgi:hypothetical protein
MGKKKTVSKNQEAAAPAFDIWDQVGKGGQARAITEPQPVELVPGWFADADMIHRPKGEARKRKVMYAKPNNIAAVELPHEGQSFNPQVDAHQDAMAKAVKKLTMQKASHEKHVEWKKIGTTKEEKSLFGGGVQPDYLGPKRRAVTEGEEDDMPGSDEEEEEEGLAGGKNKKIKAKKRRSDVPKKKYIKMKYRHDVKRTRDERRHPNYDEIAEDMQDLPEMMQAIMDKHKSNFERLARRKMRSAEGLMTKKIGRHIHHPLPIEVQTTGQLVGSLRHVKSGDIHPLKHRVKSLEARNLIPARMRHTYCKNKRPKGKGEIMIRKEPFGPVPDISDA